MCIYIYVYITHVASSEGLRRSLGEHKPGRIKPGCIKRAALSLKNPAFGNNPV